MNLHRLTILIFLISLNFQSLTKADDIRDFQIEGISIGDSALDFFSESKIIKNKNDYYKNKKFTDVEIDKVGELYDTISFNYKTGDNNYKIESISGAIFYKYNIKDCFKKRDEIVKEISDVFENTKPKNSGKIKHTGDKSGKSTLSNIEFNFKNGDLIMVSCYDWSKKMPYTDHLAISFRTKKLKDFINSNPY